MRRRCRLAAACALAALLPLPLAVAAQEPAPPLPSTDTVSVPPVESAKPPPVDTLTEAPAPPPSAALSASAGISPDTVTVGDHFRVLLRVQAPPGAVVEFPRFNLIEPVEATDSVRVRSDSLGAWTATYPLVAWTVSDSLVATFPFRVRFADGEVHDRSVRIALPKVRSVLPADSSLHVPKPARAVLPILIVSPAPRGWLVPGFLLAAVLALIIWLALRNRAPPGSRVTDPRSVALMKLAEIERSGLLQAGEVHAYYVRTSRVMREYLAATAALGEDLTTTEVLLSMPRELTEPAQVDELERLLREADRVKFSGSPPAGGRGVDATHGERVRRWIVSWPPSREDAPDAGRAEAA